MYKWYGKSKCCWAFLPDVHLVNQPISNTDVVMGGEGMEWPHVRFSKEQFTGSVWFSRAWTLQELLAPRDVVFMNSDFVSIGTRENLEEVISDTTGIHRDYLSDRRSKFGYERVKKASVAQRMNWASRREATREEDIAYSLLGIFGLNMPLLYGEGNRAFQRLQSEIIRTSNDESIFAWTFETPIRATGLLAYSINCFSSTCARQAFLTRHHYEQTNRGLRFTIPIPEDQMAIDLMRKGHFTVILPLNCTTSKGDKGVAIQLRVFKYASSNQFTGYRTYGGLITRPPDSTRLWTESEGFVTSPSRSTSKFSDTLVAGSGEHRRDIAVYFPDSVQLDIEAFGILSAEALSEQWGVRTCFATWHK